MTEGLGLENDEFCSNLSPGVIHASGLLDHSQNKLENQKNCAK
jgi:hypothetical protein